MSLDSGYDVLRTRNVSLFSIRHRALLNRRRSPQFTQTCSTDANRRRRSFELRFKIQTLPEPAQIREQFLDRLVTLVTILAQRFHHDPVELGRNVGSEASDRRWLFLRDRNDDVSRSFSFERSAASDHLVDHNAETPDVAARINRLAASLFR